jgi:hypothetical protein
MASAPGYHVRIGNSDISTINDKPTTGSPKMAKVDAFSDLLPAGASGKYLSP